MKTYVPLVLFLATLSGCATATLVESQPGVRVVVSENPGGNAKARQKATDLAKGECNGKNPVVVQYGRVKVGTQVESTTTQSKQQVISFFPKQTTVQPVQHVQGTAKDRYEWHVTFECR